MDHQTFKDPFGIGTLTETWIDSATGMMAFMPRTWDTDPTKTKGQNGMDKDPAAAFATAAKWWQNMAAAAGTPDTLASLLKSTGVAPQLCKLCFETAQTGSQEFFKQISKIAARVNQQGPFTGTGDDDAAPYQFWRDIYEAEFQKYFKLPQLGLTREYQERLNQMMDEMHLLQASYTEFTGLLAQPFRQSMEKMSEQMTAMAESGELPEDPDVYYKIWIRLLETHFEELFQTQGYVEALSKTMGALSRFSKAKDAVVEDLIKDLPVAQRSEMDELSQEVYGMKRRIRELEKAAARGGEDAI